MHRTALAAAAFIAVTTMPTFAAPLSSAARPSFDGNWSVLIVTEKGTCDRAYRYPVRISGGAVGYAGQASFNVTGRVGANGAVTVTVSRGDQSASGSGMLSSTDGSGRWRTASGECSGSWTAERRS
jgi:hypothetical protein